MHAGCFFSHCHVGIKENYGHQTLVKRHIPSGVWVGASMWKALECLDLFLRGLTKWKKTTTVPRSLRVCLLFKLLDLAL